MTDVVSINGQKMSKLRRMDDTAACGRPVKEETNNCDSFGNRLLIRFRQTKAVSFEKTLI